MIRVVVAVVLTAAVLAVSLPAIDHAATSRSDALAAGEADRLVATIEDFAAREDALAGDDPARRLVTVHVPEASVTAAPVEFELHAGSEPQVVYRIDEGVDRPTAIDVPIAVDAAAITAGDEGPSEGENRTLADDGVLTLSEGGPHELRLKLVSTRDGTVVVVSRTEDREPRGLDPKVQIGERNHDGP